VLRYAVRRLLQLVLVLFVLSFLLFIWLRSLPGGPVTALLGERSTPAKREELTAVLGLDQPVYVQYFKFLGRVLQGNFGQSTGVSPGTSAIDVFVTRFGATIELTIGAMILGLVFGVPLGYLAAKRRGGAVDNSAIVVSLIGIAFAVIFRITRASVLEVQGEDFVRTAEAKGLTSTTIRNRHVLRNAMLPVITVTGLLTGLLLTGAVLTETVFAYPGLGEALYIAFTKKDFPVIQLVILAAAAAFVIINTLVDLAYALVDPRIRAR
jgi:peptide/nickel transport system permease protein